MKKRYLIVAQLVITHFSLLKYTIENEGFIKNLYLFVYLDNIKSYQTMFIIYQNAIFSYFQI